MSVNTKVKLLGHVDENEIVKFIHDNFDRNVSSDIQIFKYSNEFSKANAIKEVYDYENGRLYTKSGLYVLNTMGKIKHCFIVIIHIMHMKILIIIQNMV